MQKPTLSDIFIRTIEDAHKLFYAVELGQLPKIEKRLNAQERAALRPGDAFVWEEKAPSTDAFNVSIERFTEGLSWTPSRVRDPFLIYYECPKKQKGRRAQKARSLEDQVVRAGESDKFIKLTYSAYHEVPADASSTDDPSDKPKKPRKWHLNAYFTKLTEGQLRTMDDIPSLRDLVVPDGTFRSARTSKNGKKGDPSKPVGSGVKRTFAPFPSQYSARRLLSAEERPAASHPPVPITSSTSQLSSAPTQSSLSTETIPVPEPSTASDTLSPVSDVPPSVSWCCPMSAYRPSYMGAP
ncbi:hypothetical protein CERSUDRAFT_87035 [Gelatoporia subvermispora B]|uniref:Gti1/Pac2 family-domain-containing protein n=1 Tax=Ceriporiopsis subvermispora (strain B) TaxID=914234 RepID=M2R445_CERS8|nr:hypothetical protein CERSUDRAFT_87035 [Gelatoporia subvermispora B]